MEYAHPNSTEEFYSFDVYRTGAVAVGTGLTPEPRIAADGKVTFVFPKIPLVVEASRAFSDGTLTGSLREYGLVVREFFRRQQEIKSRGIIR